MGKATDFIIDNGVLYEYIGQDNTVTIPEGVTGIDTYCFAKEKCKNITSVILPESLREIYGGAFFGLDIERIHIPKNVESIPYTPFIGCDNAVIVAEEGSYAMRFAKENNIPFEKA